MIPTSQDVQKTADSSFWIAALAIWLVLFAVAVTLALCLGIWNLIEAF